MALKGGRLHYYNKRCVVLAGPVCRLDVRQDCLVELETGEQKVVPARALKRGVK